MNFEMILQQAKQGNQTAVMEIVEMYKPLLIKNAVVNGVFDEDLSACVSGRIRRRCQ